MSTEFLLPKFSGDHEDPTEKFAHINTGHLGNKTEEPDLLVQDVKPDTTGTEYSIYKTETQWSS